MSIFEVARRAGVSKSTVSRVLNNEAWVKDSTRATVLDVIREMGYQPNMFAQGMKTDQSKTIAMLIPDFENPFYAAWVAAIQKEVRPHGYGTMVYAGGEDEESESESLRFLISRRIDGLIFHSYHQHEKTLQLLMEINPKTPVIAVNPSVTNKELSAVFVDGFKGTYDAVHHLILKGKKRIAYVNTNHEATVDRFEGYRKALEDATLKMPKEYVFCGFPSMETGLSAGEHFLGLPQIPDAIVSATDTIALGVMKRLLRSGIRIPEDVNVFGFDNLPISAIFEPSLSTIAIPLAEMSRAAATTLLHQIANPGSPPTQISFSCDLVLRDSTT